MSDETIQMLLDRGTYVITTFAPLLMQAEHGEAWGMPAWKVEERKRTVADSSRYDGLVKAAKAGVPIVFGTDAGSPVVPHDVIAPELAFMVKLGICDDNEHALRAITSLSARMNDLQDDRGRLAAGLAADVVVVDGNPLEDIDAVESVEAVLLDGAQVV
jgi:imidazolonepropionase-like amidohydrolase